ncbi:MAG: MBOAT family O-acyltransferase [Gammaproteobacteria bacterium]
MNTKRIQFLILWFIGAIVYLFSAKNTEFSYVGIIAPLSFCFLIIFALQALSERFKTLFAYLLFFSTGILTLFGVIKPLTGSVSESPNILFFGFSFYTLSLAFFAKNAKKLNLLDCLKVSNPALLASGPVAIFVKDYRYRGFHNRLNYYIPFFIIGFFLFHIVGVPLLPLFKLINLTDAVSSLTFAIIFELFMYANFCGISLMLYGLFGIIGYKIPLNFKQPFSSSNIIEFWRGWHLSLSAVLKLLFYEPLRKNFPPTIALLGVFLASGIWHGVTINFLIWGVFHAFVFLFTIYLLRRNIPFLPTFVLILSVIIGRLIFAEGDTDILIEKLLFSFKGFGVLTEITSLPPTTKASLLLGFGIIAVEFFFKNMPIVRKRNYKYLRTPFSLAVILIITIILINSGGQNFAVYGQR